MFCPLAYRDTIMIFRYLLILVIVIMLGVSVSERQLNSLTLRQDDVRAFTINCDERGAYSIYIFGSSYMMSAVYSVGEIVNNDKAIVIKTNYVSIPIPTYIEIDCKNELRFLELWANLLVGKGFTFKQSLEVYLAGLPQKLNVYIGHFR